ncbi:MAG: hypothetical protein R3A48_27910 [Polyangiales bacterium]
MSAGLRVVSACLAASLLRASSADAQAPRAAPSRVHVAPLGCATPPFVEGAWRALLRTELEGDGVEELRFDADDEGALAVIRLEFPVCAEGATALALSIDDAVTRKSVRRAVDLGDVPASGRARALALAAAELLRASWAELALDPSPPAPEAPPSRVRAAMVVRLLGALRSRGDLPPPAPPPPRRPVAEAPPRWSVGISFAALTFPAANAALLGGRATLGFAPSPRWPLRLRLDAGAHAGTAFDPLGEIDLGLATAALSATLLAGGERVALELGPRFEAGWAWVQGRPTVAGVRAGQGDAGVFFVSVVASLRVRVSRRWWTTLDATAGTALQPVVIESGAARAAGFTGPTLSVGLGVVVAL